MEPRILAYSATSSQSVLHTPMSDTAIAGKTTSIHFADKMY